MYDNILVNKVELIKCPSNGAEEKERIMHCYII